MRAIGYLSIFILPEGISPSTRSVWGQWGSDFTGLQWLTVRTCKLDELPRRFLIKSFLFSVGVGTAVGLLIAPQAGKKTRAKAHTILGWAHNGQPLKRGREVSDETMQERTTEQEMTPAAEATVESEAIAGS